MSLKASDLGTLALNTDLQTETDRNWFFNQFIGVANYQPTIKSWILSGSPIQKFTDFTGRMSIGNSLQVTMIKNFYGYGFDGEDTAIGNESEVTFYVQTLFVHLKRYAKKVPSIVQMQKIAWMDLAKLMQPGLARWAGAYMNADTVAAALEGYSRHLTATTANEGLQVTKKYPKNIWLWDGGNDNFTTNAPTFSQTSATYLTSIISKLGDMANGDQFDVKTLEAIKPLAIYSGIQPFTVDGVDALALVISSAQESTMRLDTLFRDAVTEGMPRGWDNPMFKTATYWYKNIVIYVDDVIVRRPYFSGSTLNFFDYDAGSITDISRESHAGQYEKPQSYGATTQNCCWALLLGANCIAYTPYFDIEFPDAEEVDYALKKGMAIQMFYGLARLDYYDNQLVAGSEVVPTAQADPQLAAIVTFQY